jgi:hypothetical protein
MCCPFEPIPKNIFQYEVVVCSSALTISMMSSNSWRTEASVTVSGRSLRGIRRAFSFWLSFEEPARRLGHEIDENAEEDDEENLDTNREAPADLRAPIADEAQAVFDPIRRDDAEDVERELEGDGHPAGKVGGRLGRPEGDDRIEVARADTVDEARTEHPCGVLGTCLQSGAEDRPDDTDDNGSSTTPIQPPRTHPMRVPG